MFKRIFFLSALAFSASAIAAQKPMSTDLASVPTMSEHLAEHSEEVIAKVEEVLNRKMSNSEAIRTILSARCAQGKASEFEPKTVGHCLVSYAGFQLQAEISIVFTQNDIQAIVLWSSEE